MSLTENISESLFNLSNSAFWGWLSTESQPQNPEFRNNLDNFHPCRPSWNASECGITSGPALFATIKAILMDGILIIEIYICDPLNWTMDQSKGLHLTFKLDRWLHHSRNGSNILKNTRLWIGLEGEIPSFCSITYYTSITHYTSITQFCSVTQHCSITHSPFQLHNTAQKHTVLLNDTILLNNTPVLTNIILLKYTKLLNLHYIYCSNIQIAQ